MKIYDSTIGDILLKNERLTVPNYQRDFAWNKADAQEFFEDIQSSIKNGIQRPIFLGTLIFHRITPDQLEIVDGQQRLTTIMVLLIACRNYAAYMARKNKKERSKYESIVDEIQSRLVLRKLGYQNQQRLEPSTKIAQVFSEMIKKEWVGEHTKAMGNKHNWNRMARVYDRFVEALEQEKYDSETLWDFLAQLDKTIVVRIVVDDGRDSAIETFERVNARGAHLAVYDLVKAYLFYEFSKRPDIDIEAEWKEIQEYAEDSESRLKKLLYQFQYSTNGYTAPRDLYRNLRSIAERNPNEFLIQLKDYAKYYDIATGFSDPERKIRFNSDLNRYLIHDRKLDPLNEEDRTRRVQYSLATLNIFGVVSVYPLIYASLRSVEIALMGSATPKERTKILDKWIDLLDFLERFSFVTTYITHISAQHGGVLEQFYSNYCKEFTRSSEPFDKLVDSLIRDFRTIKVTEQRFVNDFAQLAHGDDNKVIIYVFDKINKYIVSAKKKQVHPANSYDLFMTAGHRRNSHDIEHFFPQSLKSQLSDPEIVNNIGNLIVIHRKDNGSHEYGNNPPAVKMNYLKRAIDDNAIQNKPYIEEFINKYSPFADNWTDEVIQKRAEELGKMVFKICDYQR